MRQLRLVTEISNEGSIAGKACVQHARNVLTQSQTAAAEVGDLVTVRAGGVSIRTRLARFNLPWPRTVQAGRERRPEVVVVIREGVPNALKSMLLAGDNGLIVNRCAPTPETDQFVQAPLYREPIRLVVGQHREFAKKSGTSLAESATFPWTISDPQPVMRPELNNGASVDSEAPTIETRCA